MDVQVEDGLPSRGAGIDADVVPVRGRSTFALGALFYCDADIT